MGVTGPAAGKAGAVAKAPVALVAVASLATAAWAGLVRAGWAWDMPLEDIPASHGAIMVCGFLGTVIGIERAVALGRWWAWLVPALAAAGAVALVLSLPGALEFSPRVPRALWAASAALLFAESLLIAKRQPAMFTGVMTAAAAVFAAGNILWLAGRPLSHAVLWWAGFLVLTIAAERLELSRVVKLTRRAVVLFSVFAAGMAASLVVSAVRDEVELRLFGASLALVALWMLRCDVARRTIRLAGLPRYVASGLLSGYVWLLAGGAVFAGFAGHWGPMPRDAAYHAVFLGFVMSMIFAHAPIILPAISGIPVAFNRAFYAPLALLHASLAVRVAADFADAIVLRQWAGLANAAAIALFLVTLAASAARGLAAARR
ncbi:MAG: hypothetical protein IT452_06815 [Planctomycetia bacterium]|nr:hypothetical protein [Planctomycetia bacterium]